MLCETFCRGQPFIGSARRLDVTNEIAHTLPLWQSAKDSDEPEDC